MNSSSVPARATQPRSAAALDLGLQHRAGRLAHRPAPVEPGQVALHRGGPRLPRGAPQGVEVEVEHHVAVAALPRADGVAVDGVHVDVHREQVVAPLGAVVEHGVEEELRVDPLALQPSLHVGEGARSRCRPSPASIVGDQPLDGQCGWCGHRRPLVGGRVPVLSPAARAAARTSRRSAPPSRPGPRAVAGEHRLHHGLVLVVRVGDVERQHRDRREQLVQPGLRRVTASISIGDPDRVAMARCRRESATRWAAGSAASRTSPSEAASHCPLVGGERGDRRPAAPPPVRRPAGSSAASARSAPRRAGPPAAPGCAGS